MDRLIYTALTGLAARTRSQSVTANNLANAVTTGFRREIVAAEGRYLMPQTAAGGVDPGGRSRVQAGAPSVATPQAPGKIAATGRPLDIAMAGDAWLAVQGPVVKGLPTEAYTRRGDLSVGISGVLQNGDGRAVLGAGGSPVTVPAGASLDIAADGGLSARLGDTVLPLGRLKLVAGSGVASLGNGLANGLENGLTKGPDGQFSTREPLPVDPGARVSTGALEASNVETAGALAELVEQSRGFEVNARLLGIARDIDERTSRLMALDSN
jgi:flagellar basal-body rod protein FlgF